MTFATSFDPTKFYDRFPKTHNIYVISTISVVSGMMFGFDISSVSAFIGSKQYDKFFHTPNSILQSGITSAMAGGSFVGSIASAYISDPLGRRVSLQICSFFWIVGAAIQCSSQNVTQLIIGRFISGFGIGFGTSAAPMYISEIAPKKIRGLVGGFFQFAVTLGILIMFYIGFGCTHINGQAAFRVAWGLQMVPGIFMFAGALFLPESPRWLANHDKWEEAKYIIAQVHANGDMTNTDVQIEIEEIREQVLIDKESAEFGYMELFAKGNLKRTFVGISAQCWQQLCGMNVMMYYIVYVFEMAGFTGNTNLVSSSIQYVIFCVVTFVSLLFMDRFGRRPILIIGGFLMMTWLFTEAALLAVYSHPVASVDGNTTVRIEIPDDPQGKAAGKAIISCSYLFVASFGPSWGVIIWLYCPELFPSRQRAKATSVTTATNWIFNWALAMFVPTSFKNITWKTYIIFGVFCFTLTVQTFLMFPETKNKTLEEIDQMWKDNIPAWKTRDYVPDMPIVGEKIVRGEHIENVSDTASTSNELFISKPEVERLSDNEDTKKSV